MVKNAVDSYREKNRKKEQLKSDVMDTLEMLLREKDIVSYDLKEHHDKHNDSYILKLHLR